MRRLRLHFPFCLALLSAAIGCAHPYQVVRKNGDVVTKGRYIPPKAYAYYARARHLEAAGDYERAEAAFLETLEEDAQSGASWAGLVRSSCRRSFKRAKETFDSAIHAADRPALVHHALAQCALSQSPAEFQTAEQHATLALLSEPNNPEVTLLFMELRERQGRPQDATRFSKAYGLRYPNRPFSSSKARAGTGSAEEWRRHVDAALFAGELKRAQELSSGHISQGELAARALAWGLPDLAKAQADWVLGANPTDQDALSVLILMGAGLEISKSPDLCWDGTSPITQLLFAVSLHHIEPMAGTHLASEANLFDALEGDPAARSLLILLRDDPSNN